jgi:hypothetical protein
LFAVLGVAPISPGSLGAATGSPAFSAQETISRTHLDGADTTVDTRTVSATVSDTQNLRDRQAVTVTWRGAHPTGGTVTDHNSAAAAQQEYPVVVMQCRGVDSASPDAAAKVTPQSCWTQTPGERFQYSISDFSYPSYRMDRYATTADRAYSVGQPSPLPSGCPTTLTAPHWIHFLAADGTDYPGGNLGCGGIAPEAANAADSLQPGNTTYGVADANGNGEAKFVIQTTETNASVGCSQTVECTLEIIPIMGISCDPAGVASDPGLGMAPNTRPVANLVPVARTECERTGRFKPGEQNGGGAQADVAVTGALWWAASNWRNRIAVPLTFAPGGDACDIVTDQPSLFVYGAEGLAQATQQWGPKFCFGTKAFTLRHVQTSEPQAKNLLSIGNIEAAVQGSPPSTPFPEPVVQAPAALSGWTIAYSVDGADGTPYQNLKLNARLLAKLLSESYFGCAFCLQVPGIGNNPTDMSRDPEFQALNPGVPKTNYLAAGATLYAMSSDSDVMSALTSYINADPEARAWLNGTPDPWGMVVNPAYKKIALPVTSWPLLDTHVAKFATGANQCLEQSPVPWLPQVASPLSNPALVALNMQFDTANSQINCRNNGAENQKLVALGREATGVRFLFGLVSLADAARYQLDSAQLQTQRTSTGTGTFSDASGRTFVGPTDDAVRAAGTLMTADAAIGSWRVPYDRFATADGANAYPGTMLISIDVPTSGLARTDATNYATLLRFTAGEGQVAGLDSGQLPPGYVPLTDANGLGAFAAFTNKAASAVAAQCGSVPSVTASPAAGADLCTSIEPPVVPQTGNGTPIGAGSGAVGSGPSTGANGQPLAPGARIAGGKSTTTPTTTPIQVIPVAKTRGINTGPLGVALPVAAALALIALCGLAYNNGIGRR